MQSGWLTRTRAIVGRDSIRTVEMHAGPLAQVFGLKTVVVRTDSGPARTVRIDGLGPLGIRARARRADARRLRGVPQTHEGNHIRMCQWSYGMTWAV